MACREVSAIARPPFPWVGNKEKLVPYIQQLLPHHATQFLDVFGGSGAVILALKPRKGRLDLYNDLDNDLTNVMFCIKERLGVLSKELDFLPVQGREAFRFYRDIADHKLEFEQHLAEEIALLQDRSCFTEEQAQELLPILQGRAKLFDVYRAAAFLLAQYGSFSGTGNSFGVKTVNVDAIRGRLQEVSKRLQSIVLENRNALDLLDERDQPNGVIYADPPYYEAEKCYKPEFSMEDHIRLRDRLRTCTGYVILSYNDCPMIHDLYAEDFFFIGLKRNNPLSQKKGAVYGELFLTNYDPRPYLNSQMNLFEPNPTAKGELLLLHTPKHILKST